VLIETLKAKAPEAIVYGIVTGLNVGIGRAIVSLSNRGSCSAAYPITMVELKIGKSVALGKTKGGGYMILQVIEKEIPDSSLILIV